MAARWGLGREELDAYAARSHRRAHAAQSAGSFAREIVGITNPAGRVTADETIRPDTSVEKLATLKAVFQSEELSARFPQIRWHTTAGNASQMTDGASAMLLMSERRALQLGLRPRARFVALDVVGTIRCTCSRHRFPPRGACWPKAGMRLEQVDHYEINEAFASVPLAWQRNWAPTPSG
ncbi:3-ketoacyl-CoA thiolase [Delftia tsuruhatensis]|nr:3-ketoacyl-CoA thiolase [Delftia tsuruhatensis]